MSLDPTAERVLEAIDQIALTNGGMLNRRNSSRSLCPNQEYAHIAIEGFLYTREMLACKKEE